MKGSCWAFCVQNRAFPQGVNAGRVLHFKFTLQSISQQLPEADKPLFPRKGLKQDLRNPRSCVYGNTEAHKGESTEIWVRQMENLFSSSSEQPCGAQTHFNSLTPEPGVFQWNFLKYSLWRGEVFESGDSGVEKLSPTQWEVPQVSGEAEGWF